MNRAGNRCKLPAFTLIELLIVILIIGILVLILITALNERGQDKVAATQVIKSLTTQLEAYRAVYMVYPPSSMATIGGYPGGGGGVASGAEALYYFLHGPRGQGWGPDSQDGGVKGKGQGWKAAQGVPESWLSADKSKPRYYVDGLGDEGKPILYYRAALKPKSTKVADVYSKFDNAKYWDPTVQEFNALLRAPGATTDVAANGQSYILIAPGNDRKYGFEAGLPRSDDVTNFRSE